MLEAEIHGALTGSTPHGLVAYHECDAIQTMRALSPRDALPVPTCAVPKPIRLNASCP